MDSDIGLNIYDSHARLYDPQVPRFLSMDPHAERYYNISPYVYAANNPLNVIDPDGMDTVGIDNEGYITSVKQGGSHVISQGGQIYNFNDPDEDNEQLFSMLPEDKYNYNYLSSDRIQILSSISDQKILDYMKNAGVLKNRAILSMNPSNFGLRYLLGASMGVGGADFAPDLYFDYGRKTGAKDNGTIRSEYSGGGFFKIGSSNTLYNLHDAGNFLTGLAFNLSGYTLNEIQRGANIYTYFTSGKGDSNNDQKAIKSGYNYKKDRK